MADPNTSTLGRVLDIGVWSRAETWAARSVPLLASLLLLGTVLYLSTALPETTYNFADAIKQELTKNGADPSAMVVDFPMLGQAVTSKGAPPVFPDSLKAQDGKQVAIIGFMAPYDQIDDMTHCMIMPSYVGCYFCQPPSLAQVVFARQKDRGTDKKAYIDDPVLVSGKLMLYKPDSDHPGHLSQFLYVIEDATIKAYHGPAAPTKAKAAHIPTSTTPPAGTPNRLNRAPATPAHPPAPPATSDKPLPN